MTNDVFFFVSGHIYWSVIVAGTSQGKASPNASKLKQYAFRQFLFRSVPWESSLRKHSRQPIRRLGSPKEVYGTAGVVVVSACQGWQSCFWNCDVRAWLGELSFSHGWAEWTSCDAQPQPKMFSICLMLFCYIVPIVYRTSRGICLLSSSFYLDIICMIRRRNFHLALLTGGRSARDLPEQLRAKKINPDIILQLFPFFRKVQSCDAYP